MMMGYLVDTGIKPEPKKPIGSEHCRSAIARLEVTLEQRPNYQPRSSKALALRNPACAHGCAVCYMECAIAPERLAWWQNELAMAEAFESGASLQHEGALFLEPAGRA
jgi:hypothetical protein